MPRDPRHDILFEPVRIGPKTLKNRFYQVPQCTGAGALKPGANAAHRAVKAEGGWAALCTESCSIHPEINQSTSICTTLWDEGDVIAHRHMTDECHKWGALAGVELGAGGVKDNLQSRYVAAAFDRFPSAGIPKVYTYEAREEDIRRVMQMYADAARRAIDAGFDILYIHGAAGVFPAHALSRHFNRRKDGYGGSFENRARFWIEAIETIREVADGQCAIATRIAIDDLSGPWGMEIHDEGLRFVELVTKQGLLDLWDVIIGGSGEDKWGEDSGPSRFYKSNHQAPWNSEVKRIANVPVVGVGRFTDPDEMARVVKSGQLDIIGAARPSIADPFLPRKIDEGRTEDICECIGCNICISRFNLGSTIICTQNPTVMEEYRRGWHPERFTKPERSEAALVVGAGPAGPGMRPRAGPARLSGEPGGSRDDAGRASPGRHPPAGPRRMGPGHHLSRGPAQPHGQCGDPARGGHGERRRCARLRRGADRAGDRRALGRRRAGGHGPDPVPGAAAEHAYCVTPEQFFAGKPIGQRVVILDSDGYFMASSIAERLADQGKQVTIVTQLEKVAPMTDLTLEGFNMKRMMREKGIQERIAHWVELLRPAGNQVEVVAYDLYRDGSLRTTQPTNGVYPRRLGNAVEILNCDTVILCTARESRTELYDSLYERRGEWAEKGIEAIVRAGDCLAPRYLADAIFDGHRIAREFESADPERPKAVIRERQVWGQEVYPKLGDPVL